MSDAKCGNAILEISAARIFASGLFEDPEIRHPEGVAVRADGSVWCGTETGLVIRISPDGETRELIASTGGFCLGLAFDASGRLYVCDLQHKAVFRLDPQTGEMVRFASGLETPNYPVVDDEGQWLYVSDSGEWGAPGGGVHRFDLATGDGGLWSPGPFDFANGMLLMPDRSGLLVVESYASRIAFVPIAADGSAGSPRSWLEAVNEVPDGLAMDEDGTLYIGCYEPSRIYRKSPGGALEILIEDPRATLLCHPTNVALRDKSLFVANLGRWHVTEVKLA